MTCLSEWIDKNPDSLIVIAGSKLSIAWAKSSGSRFGSDILTADFYSVMKEGDDFIFYDWLVDNKDEVIGIDLGANAPPQINIDLGLYDYFEKKPFPRLMFTKAFEAIPLGLEAFGDIVLLRSYSSMWAVIVLPSKWLSVAQVNSLSRLF